VRLDWGPGSGDDGSGRGDRDLIRLVSLAMLDDVGCADNAEGLVGRCGGSFDALDCIEVVDACDVVRERIGLLSGRSVGGSESRSEAAVDEDAILLVFRGAGGGGDGRCCIAPARLTLRD